MSNKPTVRDWPDLDRALAVAEMLAGSDRTAGQILAIRMSLARLLWGDPMPRRIAQSMVAHSYGAATRPLREGA